MPFCPVALIRPCGKGIIVQQTIQYHASAIHKGGLILHLPAAGPPHEKKFKLGEVKHIGPGVAGLLGANYVEVGDIITYQQAAAFRIPNGPDNPDLYKIEAGDSLAVIAKAPNLDPEKRSRCVTWSSVAILKSFTDQGYTDDEAKEMLIAFEADYEFYQKLWAEEKANQSTPTA